MIVKTEMRVKVRLCDAKTRKVVCETPWQKNLIMDGGLNALAQSTNACVPASMHQACRVGSGSTSNSTASGAITFTQALFVVTASAPFFSAGMVGQLFKYGTGSGGAEYYITAFTSSTIVSVAVSATVGTPTVATVWNVTQTTLGALSFSSQTYETSGSSCGSTFSGAAATHKRTYNFALQGSPYTVNEVGYFTSTTGTTVLGRIVLGASVVVNPTNFLQVVLSLIVTYSPATPTAVLNVGTTINTAGNAVVEGVASASLSQVASNGTTTLIAGGQSFDASNSMAICGIINNYTQNTTTGQAFLICTLLQFNPTAAWGYDSAVGRMKISCNTTISTAAQTLYGVALCYGISGFSVFDVKFTTPYVTPTGSFLPQVSFTITYGRTLVN